MLSGNGRHRRPRQAPALVVAAGVTGSAIAIPLLAASNASAADTQAWDRLASCESGGQWSLDSGNGYYGGLQLSQEMWEQYGGLDFAPSADQASRSQQISVAEKVLDDRGIAAWPSCSVKAGLDKDDDSARVDPGASLSPAPSDGTSDDNSGDTSGNSKGGDSASPSDDSSDSGKSGDSDKSGTDSKSDKEGKDGKSGKKEDAGHSVTPSPSATPSGIPSATPTPGDESGKSGPGASTSPAPTSPDAGRHRGGPASDDHAGSRTGEGRHASRGDHRDGDAYTVRSGDNLWDIADSHDVRGGWSALYDLNKKTVGSDPDLILPGQSLDLGLESGEK
jgi:nucleoid-associated protein YgaU